MKRQAKSVQYGINGFGTNVRINRSKDFLSLDNNGGFGNGVNYIESNLFVYKFNTNSPIFDHKLLNNFPPFGKIFHSDDIIFGLDELRPVVFCLFSHKGVTTGLSKNVDYARNTSYQPHRG